MSGEKFPGLDVIKARAARPAHEKGKAGRPRTREYTKAELAKMPPSKRKRLESRRAKAANERVIIARAYHRTILTPEVIEELAKVLSTGAPVTAAANAIGVSSQTVSDWLARGMLEEEKDTLYGKLAESVERARARFRVGLWDRIAMGRRRWQAAAWLAERLYPAELGPPTKKLEHSGPGSGGAIRIVSSIEIPATVPDPQIAAARAALNGHANGVHEENASPPILADGVSIDEDPDP